MPEKTEDTHEPDICVEPEAEVQDAPVDASVQDALSDPAVAELPDDPETADATTETAPGTADRHARMSRIARATQIAAAAVVALLLLVIAGFQIAEGDQVRSGVSAFGVDLSGMSRTEATAALTTAIDAQGRQQLKLSDGDRSWSISKDDLGLRVDVAGVVDDAFAQGRHGWGPSRLAILWHLRDGETQVGASRIAVDPDVLDGELASIKSEIDQPKIEAVLTVNADGSMRSISSQVGRSLNVDSSRNAVLAALASGSSAQPLKIDETEPLRSDADFATAKAQLAKILDAPIDLVAVDQTWTLTPEQIAYWMTIDQPKNGKPAEIQVSQQWVSDIVDEIGGATDRAPKFPRIWWDGNGQLVPVAGGQDGRTLDREQSEKLIQAAFTGQSDGNRIDLPVAIANMTTLPKDMNSLGISTELAEASTPYGGTLPARMHNIELAASRLNGTVILPGQTFSFNAELGSTSIEAGFEVAYGIAIDSSGVSTVPSVGGGICQVATTVFQPIFWSGYEIVERNYHAYWIDRYTSNGYVGLDATVDEAAGLDFRFKNNSPTAILLEATADGQNFTVRLYGTPPPWRVEVDPPAITNQKTADQKTHYEPTGDLPDGSTREVEHASDGFDVAIVRRVIEGDQVRTDEFDAQYAVARNVVLVGSSDGTLPDEYNALNSDEYVGESDATGGDSEVTDGSDSTDTVTDGTTDGSETTDGATTSDTVDSTSESVDATPPSE